MKWNDGFVLQDLKPYEINKKFSEIRLILNGQVGFGQVDGRDRNLDGSLLQHTFSLANVEEEITHDLGSIPVGYIALRSSNGGVVYDGITQDSKTSIFLRSTTPANTVTLFIAR